jgi:four helix bundle protein
MDDSLYHARIWRAITGDPLWKLKAYQIAIRLMDAAREDATKLRRVKLFEPEARQLYRAVGSIAANISEGYSRSGGPDRARFFDYALGSVRESLVWYFAVRTELPVSAVGDRVDRLVDLRRLLLTSIGIERYRRRIQGKNDSGEGRVP